MQYIVIVSYSALIAVVAAVLMIAAIRQRR